MQDWEAWIADGSVKAIMGWPINAAAMIPVTKKAHEANVAVLGYAVAWKGVSASLLTDPEKDGEHMAAYAVDWINKNYGEKSVSVAILSDQQNDLTRLRVEGLYKAGEGRRSERENLSRSRADAGRGVYGRKANT